nr:hypothetical protein [Planctomycetota bacterium]
MLLRLPHLRQLFVRALLGMAVLICAPYAEALDVNATFTIAQQPAVVDLNGALVAGVDYAATFTEAGGAVAIADPAAATLTDLIQDTVVGARVRITNQLDGAAELLDAVVTGTAIAKSYDASTGLLTLSGLDTVAHYQAVLRSLVYDNSSLNPSATARVISVIVNDGFVDSLAANCVLTMVPVNNAPALDLNGPLTAGGNFAALFIEGRGAVVVVDATALTVADPDNATLVSATATITARQDGAAELLDATVQGGISKSFDAATGVLSLTGSASLATYQAVLRTLAYDNVGSPPIGGNRQVTVVVNDGALDSPTVFCVLAVQARNHTPTLDALADRSVLENSGLLSIPLTGIGDGGDLVGQNLTVTATSSNQAILLDPTVVYTSAQATGTLMLAPVAFEFGTTTVTVTVHDDGGTAFGSLDTFSRTFQLTIVPVNQRPSLAALADLVINEDDPAQTVQIAGISAGPANESAQVLTVTAISSRPDIIPNPTVFYASPQAAGALQFTPLAHQSGVVTIFVQVADNGGTANGGRDRVARSFTVTVTPKSHVPVLVTDAGLTVPVHGSGVISYLALETQDFGSASALVYHLSALPTDGLLELGGTALTLSDTFTQADINAGLLSYVNTGFVAGSDAFQFTVVNAQGNSLPVTAFPITISGAAVGTTPAVTLPGPAVTWVQGGGPVVLDGGATVVDASGTLAGGNLQISLIANGSAGDLLAVRSVGNGLGQIAVSGTTVTYEGTTIGTLSGGSGAALLVTLAAAADPTAVQALLRSITFDNADAAPSAATRRAQVVLD